MSETFDILAGGDVSLLIIGDHASNHVPSDIDFAIPAALLDNHIAIDIGVAEVAGLLVRTLSCTAILGGVSRLVVDLNREPDAPGIVPVMSDGHPIPGNRNVDIAERMIRFHHPYHHQVGLLLDAMTSPFILSLHSFTPALHSKPGEKRPWDIGILYNQDDRAARIAIPLLKEAGLVVGDQLPYSGKLLNATMNRHAEANGIPYLGVEMRQDLVSTANGQRRFTDIVAPVLKECVAALA
jgi:predicted N-formylglutamate amidohydrolase